MYMYDIVYVYAIYNTIININKYVYWRGEYAYEDGLNCANDNNNVSDICLSLIILSNKDNFSEAYHIKQPD